MNIAITHCLRCNNELTYKEHQRKAEYCEKCERVKRDEKHRD